VRVRVRERKQPSARLADGNGMEPHDDELPRLDHENLDVYRCSLDFLRLALGIVATLPRGEGELRAQLKTAAMSVPLNIAEDAGKPGATDRARFHGIARGSAMECAALVDVHHRRLRRRWARTPGQGARGAYRRDAEQDVPLTRARARARARLTITNMSTSTSTSTMTRQASFCRMHDARSHTSKRRR
jgi:four helix bundle protein